jgi:hypothetical protein
LRVPANARRQQVAMDSLDAGRGVERELVDPGAK